MRASDPGDEPVVPPEDVEAAEAADTGASMGRRAFVRRAAVASTLATGVVWSAPKLTSVALAQTPGSPPVTDTSTQTTFPASTSSTAAPTTSTTIGSGSTTTSMPPLECQLLFDGVPSVVREFRYNEDTAPPNVSFSVELSAVDTDGAPATPAFQISQGTSWVSVSPRSGGTPNTITFTLTPRGALESAKPGDGGCEPNAVFCGEHTMAAVSRDGLCDLAVVTVRLVILEGSTTTTAAPSLTTLGPTVTQPPPTSASASTAAGKGGKKGGTGRGSLAFTGSEAADLVMAGGALVLTGRALLAVRNRLWRAVDDDGSSDLPGTDDPSSSPS